MPSLYDRVDDFYGDLAGGFSGVTQPGHQVVSVYNTLLVLAQSQRQDDPVISKLSELSQSPDVSTLRVLVGQIRAALRR